MIFDVKTNTINLTNFWMRTWYVGYAHQWFTTRSIFVLLCFYKISQQKVVMRWPTTYMWLSIGKNGIYDGILFSSLRCDHIYSIKSYYSRDMIFCCAFILSYITSLNKMQIISPSFVIKIFYRSKCATRGIIIWCKCCI